MCVAVFRRPVAFAICSLAVFLAAPNSPAQPPNSPAQSPDSDASKSAATEYFETHVRPLLLEHCHECHAADEQAGGLRLDSRTGWQKGGDSGPAIVPGDTENSLLLRAVRYDDLSLQMPPEGKLADAEIAVLQRWIRSGAVDPRDSAAPASPPSHTGMSVAAGRSFWSLQPITTPAIPTAPAGTPVLNPIDAFVFSKLAEHQLTPAGPASRREWLRRITFDLTGLPPTPAEIDLFLKDESPQAFERVIDRLLQSHRYGERWGRHWLDVARYADSNGLDENLAFGNAWRYRDYVIDAFNADKPTDEFIVEQIAGDLLPRADRETRIATGFLALGARVLAEPDRTKLEMDTIDEQIDSLGKAFLGMTLGCARCHDHKFDPIRQRDYYSLAAIFKGTESFAATNTGAIKHWFEHSFATPEQLAELKQVDAAIAAKNAKANQFKNQTMQAIRKHAVELAPRYLAAAALLTPDPAPQRLAEVADQFSLHPRILHHCRLHLHYRPEDPLVELWQSVSHLSPDKIETYFQTQINIQPTDETPAEQVAIHQAIQTALADPAGVIAVPPQPEHAFAPSQLDDYYALLEDARLLESRSPDEPAAMGVRDGQICDAIPIHIRGSHQNLGQPVPRAFPAVMWNAESDPVFPAHQSGRLELARWIASSRHPLTARVYVNRIWRWHFGRGLVATTENFGALGAPPTHPELLDWLAQYFMRHGWSTKALQRLITSSHTYRMASQPHASSLAEELDPENRWLSHFPLRRLEAEEVRDAILVVSGRLDESMGGKTVPLRNRQFVFNHTSVDHTKYDSLRRAVYLPIIRNNLYELLRQFDYPDPTMPTGNRASTTVAPQALLLLNDPLVVDSAEQLAQLAQAAAPDTPARIVWLHRQVLGRPPHDHEVQRASTFLTDHPNPARWTMYCQALLASNEFMHVP